MVVLLYSPGSENGRGGRRGRRSDRTSQPPRFNRGGSGTGRGASRGSYPDKGRGGRGRGGSLPTSSAGRGTTAPKKSPQQSPTQTNNSIQSLAAAIDPSNEGEEWETASESSDVATKGDKDTGGKKEAATAKKSFSSQRPTYDRQNRGKSGSDSSYKSGEGSSSRSGTGSRDSNKKERSPPSKFSNTNGRSGGGRGNRSPPNNRKENVSVVYRVDGVEHEDPTAVQNAINTASKQVFF